MEDQRGRKMIEHSTRGQFRAVAHNHEPAVSALRELGTIAGRALHSRCRTYQGPLRSGRVKNEIRSCIVARISFSALVMLEEQTRVGILSQVRI
jgi:hypothetical protein